jgi:ATP-binding cassette subfamily C protein
MLKRFVRELIRFSRLKVITAYVLFVLSGITQGVGLVMIIPFLSILGLPGEGDKVRGFSAAVARTFAALGLPLNLYTLLTLYIVIVSLFAFLNRFQAVLNIGIQQGFVRYWRNRLYRTLTYADWLFIAREKSSDITHALTSDIQQIGSGTLLLLQFSSSLVLILFHLVVAVLLSLPLTGITLAFAGTVLIFMKPLNREAFTAGVAFRSSRQNLYAAVMEHLTGMKTAKSYGVEKQHIERIESINKAIEARVLGFARARANTRLFYEITAVIFLSGFFWAAIELFEVPAARLLLLAFIFIRLLPRLSALQQQYQNIKNMLPAFSGARELYDRARAAREPGMETAGAPPRFKQAVSFKGVWFRYSQNNNRYAIENANFDIPAQKITAVTGPSGAGKSTLADLLLGLLQPEKGSIGVDEKEITADRLYGWRHSIGYVPQETFLFHDTLRANLLWANPSASQEDLWEVLRLAAAEDFVKNLANGLDTVIGDRGITLSGGERQRIALARALLRKPQILLLDEATSALDSRNEQRIQQAIRSLQGKLTVVIIAHRLSTLRCADFIIVLDKGQVKETGTWDSLSKNKKSALNRMIAADGAPGHL